MSRSRRFVIVGAVAFIGVACSRGTPAWLERGEARADAPDSVFVEVINDNFYDARIHVIYDGGARFTVGTIGGQTRQESVAIPWEPRPLVVRVMMIVQDAVYLTDPIDVVRGDVLQVRLPPNFATSGWFRRVS